MKLLIASVPMFFEVKLSMAATRSALVLFGLVIGALTAFGQDETPQVTFNKDVAPILYQHCVVCHHPNDIAPMSLMTYKEARPWAAAIREAVVRRVMPPWHADPHVGEFRNDPRLTDQDIQTIDAWAKSGAKEGDRGDNEYRAFAAPG